MQHRDTLASVVVALENLDLTLSFQPPSSPARVQLREAIDDVKRLEERTKSTAQINNENIYPGR
jgi:hypothetical protein